MLKPPKPSESPTFIHNKAINSLEKYIDYELEDNCSFLSDDQTCSVDEENAKPSSFARKLSGWTDVITKTLKSDKGLKDTLIIKIKANLLVEKKVNIDYYFYSLPFP